MAITVYDIMPIPPAEEATHWVDVAPLRIGVEWRFLDEGELQANYDEDEANRAIAAAPPGLEDEGVSIHVFGDDGLEYLRFDMFDAGPHYHYIGHAIGENVIVDYDPVAFGPMLPFALDRLSNRLEPMLERAGAKDLAARVDSAALAARLGEVERLVSDAAAEIERQRAKRAR